MVPISSISISSRIYIGFVLLSLFILIIGIIAYEGTRENDKSFKNYENISELSQHILMIENDITSLQLGVQNYIYTGYQAVADRVNRELVNLTELLNKDISELREDKEAYEYLLRMQDRLKTYSRTFIFAVEQRQEREKLIAELKQLHTGLINNQTLTEQQKLVLLDSEKRLLEYIEDPDILKINESINALEQLIKKSETISAGPQLADYRKKYIDVIQSTRGFLFLISVVMAGEAQEFRYLSGKLKENVLSRIGPVKADFNSTISKTRSVIISASMILLLLSAFLSYRIATSIHRPLDELTKTFRALAKNQKVESIPGINLHDEIGEMSKAAEIFRRKNEKTNQLVRELDRQKAIIERSNDNLEQFAYVASHDLQEPIRTIVSFSDLLNSRYREVLGEDGEEYLKFISDAGKRMRSLIVDLLEYSRIGKDMKLVEVDCNRILDDVQSDLALKINETKATIQIEELPVVQGHDTSLRMLFQNLLSNALKFNSPGTNPLIEISACREDEMWKFAVKDNGIGIADQHKERIFTIFSRLHARDKYDGTGIGLANCKKIIDMHNGKIWVESVPGSGCRFMFTLPV